MEDEVKELRLLARALYSSWQEAVAQLDEYWRERHGHLDEEKKYEGPEFAWLREL